MKKKPDRRAGRQPPPSVERRGADRRRADRILVDLKVDFRSEDMYLYAFITDLSAMGLFILSGNPHPIGSRLHLRFELPGQAELLEAMGEVRWTCAPRPGQTTTPGMGVEFTSILPEVAEKLSSVIKRVIYFEADNLKTES